MTARALFALAVAAVALVACGPPARPPTVSLRVRGNVPDALVTIDDVAVGPLAYVAARGVALPPGTHRVTVERTGYFPWDRLVEASGEPVALEVVLVKVPE